MNKTCVVCVCLLGVAAWGRAEEEEKSLLSDKKPSKMKEMVVKDRAERKYEKTDGVSPSGHKYIYVDDKDIKAASEGAADKGKRDLRHGAEREINIGSTNISKKDNIRDIDVVVKADKKIDIKTDGQPTKVNLGQVQVDDAGLRKRDVNVIIDAKEGIKVH